MRDGGCGMRDAPSASLTPRPSSSIPLWSRHRLGIEQAVELFTRHQSSLADQIVHIAPGLQRLFRNFGRGLVSECRHEGGDNPDGILDELLHPLLVRSDPFDTAVLKNLARPLQIGHSAQQAKRDDRLEYVELQLTCFRCHCHGYIATDYVEANLIHHFRYDWVDFARHDRRPRLHRRQVDLAEAGAWSRAE